MSLQDILSDDQPKGHGPKQLAELCLYWSAVYSEHVNLPHKLDRGEKKALEKFLNEFGLDLSKKVITFFIENHKSLKIIQGYPSVYAMVGFRRTLVPMAMSITGEKEKSFNDDEFWSKKVKK
jgi:hypothetical protein